MDSVIQYSLPFLLHFQTTMAIQPKNKQERHQSEDNLKGAVYRNLPDLRNKNQILIICASKIKFLKNTIERNLPAVSNNPNV